MFNRLKHTSQGILIGVVMTLAFGITAYVHTHDIKFTAVATNQPQDIVRAENDAISMAALMPSDPRPAHKPAVKQP